MDRLISIELFGQAYTFRASGQVSQPEEVANYVAGEVEKARATGEAPSKLDTVILAALNIANDYLELRRSRQDLVRDIDQRCKILIEYIDANA
ncbi:MAG: cell division protein ZapA [Desulfobacterales bacterium]|nr:cell division protein ZapA [Desulfobacterales bacterium]